MSHVPQTGLRKWRFLSRMSKRVCLSVSTHSPPITSQYTLIFYNLCLQNISLDELTRYYINMLPYKTLTDLTTPFRYTWRYLSLTSTESLVSVVRSLITNRKIQIFFLRRTHVYVHVFTVPQVRHQPLPMYPDFPVRSPFWK